MFLENLTRALQDCSVEMCWRWDGLPGPEAVCGKGQPGDGQQHTVLGSHRAEGLGRNTPCEALLEFQVAGLLCRHGVPESECSGLEEQLCAFSESSRNGPPPGGF